MKIPRYIVIKLEMVGKDTVKATEITDRCEVYEYEADEDEPQIIRCPKCGRIDYIRDMEKDMGVKGSGYKYKCINCNTYIKDEPQTERKGESDETY